MHSSPRKPVTGKTTLLALVAFATALSPRLWAQNRAASDMSASSEQSTARWGKVSVQLPTSATVFPAGEGADIANSQCLKCHSVSMVLTQPALTPSQWQVIINKMRTAYGAPLPAEQVDALAAYLSQLMPGGFE
jgi:mono/diheme cytochrome c family protein